METQQLAIRVPKELFERARRVAAVRSTNVTALVIEGLRRVTTGAEAYVAARDRQAALMAAGLRLREVGELLPSRDSSYEV